MLLAFILQQHKALSKHNGANVMLKYAQLVAQAQGIVSLECQVHMHCSLPVNSSNLTVIAY